MPSEANIEKARMIRTGLVLLCAGPIYFLFIKITGHGIPCPVHLVTGLKCPGCGISTMAVMLAELQIREAFLANRFIFVTLPFLIFEILFSIRNAAAGRKNPRANEIAVLSYAAALIAWGIFRNIAGM